MTYRDYARGRHERRHRFRPASKSYKNVALIFRKVRYFSFPIYTRDISSSLTHIKLQDPRISGSRVSQLSKRLTDGQAQINMPPQLLQSCGHKNNNNKNPQINSLSELGSAASKTLVHPKLGYATSIWNPDTKHSCQTEKVKRKAC